MKCDRVPAQQNGGQMAAVSSKVQLSQAGAGAASPRPGSFGGEGFITSGNGVAACAPIGVSTLGGGGGGGVNFPVRMISSTCTPSSVSYSSNELAISSSLSR